MLCCAVLCCIVVYRIARSCAGLHCVESFLYRIAMNEIGLDCVVLCCAGLRCVVLCYIG